MNKIICGGLVIALLMTGVMSVATAEEYSDEYKDGFYNGAVLLGQARALGGNLYSLYMSLGGQFTEENEEIVTYYNEEATMFNENVVPYINNELITIFGEDDNRTAQLGMVELPLIET